MSQFYCSLSIMPPAITILKHLKLEHIKSFVIVNKGHKYKKVLTIKITNGSFCLELRTYAPQKKNKNKF